MLTPELLIKLLFSAVLSVVLGYGLTPLVKKLAPVIGAMDIPKDERRMHSHPIPRIGGLAIYTAFLISSLIFSGLDMKTVGILVGSLLIVVTGVFDDIKTLSPKVKFLCQFIAAAVTVAFGVRIQCPAGLFTAQTRTVIDVLLVPVTVLWIVGVTNAVNFIDGLDGLACGVSSIASAAMLVASLCVSGGNIAVPVLLVSLLGGCLGFLPFNFNPATIFMGDTGALMLGFVLSGASVVSFFKFDLFVTFLVPVLILGHPIIDTLCAIIRRLRRGVSPFAADRGHIHHKLIDCGLSVKQAVSVLYTVSAVLGVLSVTLLRFSVFQIILLVLVTGGAVYVDYTLLKGKKLFSKAEESTPAKKSGKSTANTQKKNTNPNTKKKKNKKK